jgi:hypothetical protein
MTWKACLICGRAFEVTGPKESRCPLHTAPKLNRGRSYRNTRDLIIANATVCGICGKPPRDDDPFVVDHIQPRASAAPTTPPTCKPPTAHATDAKAQPSADGNPHD